MAALNEERASLLLALTARAEKAEAERDEARAKLAAARWAWDQFEFISTNEDKDELTDAIDAALSDATALAVVERKADEHGFIEGVVCREVPNSIVTVVVLPR